MKHFLFLLALCASPAWAADPIRIGDSFAYADFARFGGPYKKGWELAVEDINAKGGICFKKDDCHPVEVISVDHTADPAKAQRLIEGLIERDKVDVLAGTVLTNVTNALGTLAAQKKVPIMTVWSSVLAENGPQNPYMFSMMPVEPHSMASAELAAKLPIARWAIIGPDIAWGRTGNALFKKRLKELRPDVEFVTEQWPPLMKFNASAEFAALRKAKPEGVFSTLFGTDFFAFVREGTRLGFFKDKTIIATEAAENAHLDVIGKIMTQGTWYGTGEPVMSKTYDAFYKRYSEKYGEAPELYSVAGYNIYTMLAKGIEKAQSRDPEKVRKALEGLKADTPIGPLHITSSHRVNFGVWLGAIKNGKQTIAQYYDASHFIGE